MKTKICKKCNIEKSLSEFGKRKNNKIDGHRNECKDCINKQHKKWRKRNPEKVKEGKKKYYKNNLEKVKEKNKKYRENNPDKVKEGIKKWAENNSEKVKEKNKKWVENNPDKVKERKKKWKENNPEYFNKYTNNRRKNDVNFKILANLRTRLNHALKGKNKSESTKKLLGCSIEFLKTYLENQFDENMTWENYGSYWEIDHIIPCSSFNFSNETEQKRCFNWLNLQPLSTQENLKKSNKLDYNFKNFIY